MTKYEKNLAHIAKVKGYLTDAAYELLRRRNTHDQSKLVEPERSAYEGVDEATAMFEYGTPEYKAAIEAHLGAARWHHYQHNSHHPEHYPDGIAGMSLFDLLEMLCDWQAVCVEKGKPTIDLEVNRRVYNMSDDVYKILGNTVNVMGWQETKPNENLPTLASIVEQLRFCRYVCEAGPLENNAAFQALERLAECK